MYFNSFPDFLAMGNHGLYVWLSYGFFVLMLIWMVIDLRLNRKTNLKNAERTWARDVVAFAPGNVSQNSPEEISE